MFFGSNKNQNNGGVNINTRFETLYSDTASLTYGGWNNMLSIRMQPSVGKDENGLNQYNADAKCNTSLSQSNAKALYEAYKNVIEPVIGTADHKSVSVSMGKSDAKNILSIIYDKDENNEPTFSLQLVQSVSPEGIASDDKTTVFTFNKTNYLEDYNPVDGSGVMHTTNAEFLNFIDRIKNIGDLLPVSAHGMRYSDAIGKAYSSNNQNQSAGNNAFYEQPTNGDYLPFN